MTFDQLHPIVIPLASYLQQLQTDDLFTKIQFYQFE